MIDLDHVEERRPTEPEGTSERKASGSETMKASSEAARTSRAAAPRAAPAAAKAAPPARIATRISPIRPQSRSTNSSRPAEHQHRHHEADRPPRGRPSRRAGRRAPTSPRVSREKAFSSRSSASEPATSSTVTNISGHRRRDRDREDVERRRVAADHLLVHLDRLGDRREQRAGEVEVVAGEVGEADHLVERLAPWARAAPTERISSRIRRSSAGRGCPRRSPRSPISPPLRIRSRYVAADSARPRGRSAGSPRRAGTRSGRRRAAP